MKHLIDLNVGVRVFDFLKENVKMDMKASEKTGAYFNELDNAYLIRDNSQNDSIEFLLMLLSNVTIKEVG